jgi:HAE1 family hydrophobic/amphiphilic exporter-1
MTFLARLSLANKSVVTLATVALILIGAYVLPTLRQEILPSLSFPEITVVSIYPGASPGQVEQDVTNPIEQTIQGQSGIIQTFSQSSGGLSVIRVSYDFNADLDKAQQKLQEQMNQLQSSLPPNVIPQIQQNNIESFPIITLAVSSSEKQQDLATGLKKFAIPELQSINGVATVNITGVRQQIVTVSLDLAKMQAKGVSIQDVQTALQANNITLPAGEVDSNGQILPVRVGNTFTSLQALKNLVVGPGSTRQSGSQDSVPQSNMPVKLSDIATVGQELAPSSTLSRVNGKESLGIALTKTDKGNSVSISQDVKSVIPDLQNKLGNNARITFVYDDAPYIEESILVLIKEGVLGAGFAILVILVFLLSIRSTIVTAISIPLSVLITLIALWVQDYSLNLLTLSGLTVAIGRVVDDSIVVLENIHNHLHKGEPKHTATLLGTKEVAGAVTSSTLTTVAVFLPLAFVSGIVGEYAHPLALTVTIALLASLLVSLTVIPVLAYWFLKAPKEPVDSRARVEKSNILVRGYTPLISWVTKHRRITVILSVLLLVGSFSLFPLLPTNVFGNDSSSTFFFTLTLPKNTTLDRTNQAAIRVENVLRDFSEIQTYETTVGSSNVSLASATATNVASFVVTVAPGVDTLAVQQSVSDRLKTLSDIGTVDIASQTSTTQDLTVQAPDDATLQSATNQVMDVVTKHANTTNVKSNFSDAVPLIDVQVDPAKAALRGLTSLQVAQLLQTIYTGTTATQVVLDGTNNTRQDVNLRIATSANTVQDIRNMLIPSPTGPVRLGDVANVSSPNVPGQISHFNAVRTATVTFTVTDQDVQGVADDVFQQVSNLNLPAGAQVSPGISSSQGEDVLSQLYLALLFALPLVFLIMVATFRSLLQPLILLVAIPFAAMGSIVLAALTQTPIGISSLLGALMLIGIVVTNAIVLIDRVNQYRAEGMDARSAVIAGGRDRVRPILMTALATIMALIPTALGLGGSTSNFLLSSALSIIVIGGLTSSTLLTLFLVPTLYVIVETAKEHFTKKVAQNATVKEEVLAALPDGTGKGKVLVALPNGKGKALAALSDGNGKGEVLVAQPNGTARGNGLIARYGGTEIPDKLFALKKTRMINAEGETMQNIKENYIAKQSKTDNVLIQDQNEGGNYREKELEMLYAEIGRLTLKLSGKVGGTK